MIESPLTILNHHPGKFRIDAAADGLETSDTATIRVKHNWARHAKNKQTYRVEILVSFGKVKKDQTPELYRGEAEMIGYFKVHDDYPAKHVEDLIGVTAVSVLYGAARE